MVTDVMGYEQFFGLNDPPFSLAPNPRYLFESASHGAALQQLAYALERREPVIVMTGEIGVGKTLLCRTVLQRFDRRTFASVINNPLLGPDDLLRQMLQDFGVLSMDRATMPGTTRHDLTHALEQFLSSLIDLEAHAVVLIDEAQHLQPEVLEQIRLLSNVSAPSGTMLQIILIGQLDLEALLERPELRQFQQRVSRRIRLAPLGESELQAYINHRLAIGRTAGSNMPGAEELARALSEWAGDGDGVRFTPAAVQAVWRWSGGLPRVVNLLCDRALEAAYAQRLRQVDGPLVETAAVALDLHAAASAAVAAPVSVAAAPASEAAAPAAAAAAAAPALAAASAAAAPAATAEAPPPREDRLPESFRLEPLAEPELAALELAPPSGLPRRYGLLMLVAILAAAAGAVWVATRAPVSAVPPAQSAPATPVAPAVVPSAPPASTEPPAAIPPAAAAPPVSGPPAAAPARPAGNAAAGAPAAAATGFEILVASFRTEVRAAAVEDQVKAAGLRVRRRVTPEWQQVIVGPFASREEADAARQRLDGVGLTGTQIVSVER
jgi:general secretion pathway protein A